MEERQALRIDYAHGTVPGTAFVIDEPFPIPPCAPRVPSVGGAVSALGGGTAALGVGLSSAGAWSEPQRRDEPPWMGRDWQTHQQQPFFPDVGRFQGVDGLARRPNGSYMRGPFQGPGGRGGRPGTNFEDGGGVAFPGGLGRRPETGGFRGQGFTGRQRGGPDGGRGRGIGSDATDSFRRGGDRGQTQRRPMSRGMRGDGGAPRGRGRSTGGPAPEANRGSQPSRGRGRGTGGPAPEENRGSQPRGRGRGTGGHAAEANRGSQPSRGRGRGTGGPAPEENRGSQPPRGRGRGAGEPAPEEPEEDHGSQPLPFSLGSLLSQMPPNKSAIPGKNLTAQAALLAKHPQGSKFKNRFSDANDSGSPHGAKNHSTGGKPPHKDGVRKSPAKTGSRTRSPRKSSSKPRSPRDSSSRTRSPGGRRSSRTRSSSKSRSRRSRSRSRRYRSRSRSPHRHRSRSGSPHKNRSPRITRSPYRTSSLLPGQEEGFGIRVVGFPVWVSDVRIQDELYHEFKRHGKVVSIDMYGCLEDRYAVVFYLLSAEREAALVAVKGHCFFGRSVHLEPWDSSAAGAELRSWESDASYRPLDERADEFHPRATKILFVGNLEKTLTREDLSAVFNRYGEVLGIDLKKMFGLTNRFAFIQYIDIAGVCRAIKAMDGELLRNARLRLGFGRSKSTNCVWVDGLPGTLTEAQLTAHFSAHGTVLKLSFDSAKGVALVFFKTVEQAEAALQEARGQTVGGNRIKVDFANARSQAAFYRVIEPGPEDGVDVEPEEKPVQEFKSSDIEAGDVLRKVLLV